MLSINTEQLGTCNLPSHILAVHAPVFNHEHRASIAERLARVPWLRHKVAFIPVKGVLFAAACTRLPLLPRTSLELVEKKIYEGRAVRFAWDTQVPIVPIRVHNLETFPLILEYVYFASEWRTHARFFPREAIAFLNRQPIPRDDWVEKLLYTFDLPMLLKRASVVHGFYQNVLALGIADPDLWKMLDYTWEGIIVAIYELANRANRAAELDPTH